MINQIMFDYKSKRWELKRKHILKRDGYMCQWCKRYGRRVDAMVVHHIKHADEYPELAYDDDNLISLCAACHNKAHSEKAKKANMSPRRNTPPPFSELY